MSDWNNYLLKAKNFLGNHSKLLALLSEALLKAGSTKESLLSSWDRLMTLIRLVKAWARGDYRQVPWLSIASAVAAIIYFVNPFDVIPDFIPLVGYLDDATVIGFALEAIEEDLNNFLTWEQN